MHSVGLKFSQREVWLISVNSLLMPTKNVIIKAIAKNIPAEMSPLLLWEHLCKNIIWEEVHDVSDNKWIYEHKIAWKCYYLLLRTHFFKKCRSTWDTFHKSFILPWQHHLTLAGFCNLNISLFLPGTKLRICNWMVFHSHSLLVSHLMCDQKPVV